VLIVPFESEVLITPGKNLDTSPLGLNKLWREAKLLFASGAKSVSLVRLSNWKLLMLLHTPHALNPAWEKLPDEWLVPLWLRHCGCGGEAAAVPSTLSGSLHLQWFTTA
jgi:hypothetical protein